MDLPQPLSRKSQPQAPALGYHPDTTGAEEGSNIPHIGDTYPQGPKGS